MTALLDGLDEYIEAELDEWRMPGAAVAVVYRDEVIYARGHGVRHVDGGAAIDENTLFQVGSTTKAFTAAAVGVLVDARVVGWDDPVVDHLPGFQLSDPWLTRHLTVRDTLAHTTGFRDSWSPNLEVISSDEALRRMRHSRTFDPFRASFNYSNLMYTVAGKVVEAASGLPWGEFVRTHLLEPLGMSRSGTSVYDHWEQRHVAPAILGVAATGDARSRDARDPNIAMPHVARDGAARVIPWQSYDALAPAGALISTVSDMAQWTRLNLGRGSIDGRQVISAPTVEQLHGAQNRWYASRFPFDAGAGAYGLGWFRDRYRDHLQVAHGGLMLGSPALVSMLPGEGIGVVVLANCQAPTYLSYLAGEDPAAFHRCVSLWVFDHLLGLADTGLREELTKRMSAVARDCRDSEAALNAARRKDSVTSLPLEAYAGVYHDTDGLYGPMEIRPEDDELVLRFAGDGAYRAVLEHWHHDVFLLRSSGSGYRDPFATFTIGPRGGVESMNVFETDFRPDGSGPAH